MNSFYHKGFLVMVMKGLGLILGYAFLYLVAKRFGTEGSGIFSLSLTLLTILSVFSVFGLDTYSTKNFSDFGEKSKLEDDESVITYTNTLIFLIVVSFVLLAITFSLSTFLSVQVFKNIELKQPFQIICFAIPFWSITKLNAGVLRGLGLPLMYSFLTELGKFLFATAVVLCVLISGFDFNIFLPIWSLLISCVVLSIISCIAAFSKLGICLKHWKFSIQRLLSQVRGALPFVLAAASVLIMNWMDKIIIGIYMNESEVGVYHVSMKVAALVNFALIATNAVSVPKIAKAWKNNNRHAFNSIMKLSYRLVFVISIPIFLFAIIYSEDILSFFGEDFRSGTIVLQVLALGQLINSLAGPVGKALQMTGNQKYFQNILLSALVLNLILNLILVPLHGILGAAVATAIATIYWNLLSVFYLKRKLNFS